MKYFLIIILLSASCTKFDEPLADVDKDFEIPPEMEFFGFKRESYVTNFKQLDLFATNAKFYDSRDMIELYSNDTYTYEADGTIASSASAVFTTIDQSSLFTTLYTNVSIKFSNDTILYTEYLEWDNDKEFFQTPDPVRIEQDNGNWLTGVGMEGNMNMEVITVYNEVDEGEEGFEGEGEDENEVFENENLDENEVFENENLDENEVFENENLDEGEEFENE